MKNRIACLFIICLFILSNTAFAGNWIYVTRYDNYYNEGMNLYIDSENVVKNSELLTFWELAIYDREADLDFIDGVKKVMVKHEAKWTSPREIRDIECYYYDAKNNELGHENVSEDSVVGKFSNVRPGETMDQLINVALRYAK